MITSTDKQGDLKRWVYDLDGIAEATEFALRDPVEFKANSQSSRTGGTPWCGGADWAAAAEMTRTGWEEGREKIAALSAQIFAQCRGERRMAPKLRMNVAGFAPCIPAAIAGAPESMFDTVRQQVLAPGGKIVTVVQNVFVSAGCSPASVMARGIVAAALVDCLEALGHRVEFIWTMGGQVDRGCSPDGNECLQLIRFTMKRPEEAVPIDSLSAWVAHVAGFRRLGFALQEQVDNRFIPERHHYFTPDDRCVPQSERGDLFINSANLGDTGPEGCAIQLRAYLAELGVEFES